MEIGDVCPCVECKKKGTWRPTAKCSWCGDTGIIRSLG